jgi:DNA-directed RNA polymerase specialized sigma24 family protein
MTNGQQGPTDDAALVHRMVEGFESALEDLYDRYAQGIFAMAYRLTSDRGVAEEVVQETFLALWNRAES